MKITTSAVDRCIASLTSFMAGFFPPPVSDNTIPFRWQSFPFAVDNEARILTLTDGLGCDAFFRDFLDAAAKVEYDPTIRQWLKEDQALLQKVGDYMGKPILDFHDAFMAAEAIRTQQFLEPTPTWLVSAYAQLQRYFVHFANLYHKTELMKKARGGPMITEVVDNMVAMRNNSSTARNMIIFSAHDFTLVSLLTVLGVKNQAPQVAAYGDAIAIEMYQTGNAEPDVKVMYMSNTIAVKFKIELFVPNCGRPCKLNTFNNLMSKYIVRDYEGMCRL